ncbi:uncharacterized protein LOC131847436 [Achroia grisella]|uniref:uncharacterized protein LOC131847436 n=1 Tax=Achroia grisella TaxID=688607 RepID=UPI0027D230DC|nr:uncharacterized protein LOC131847436 [Achroia grisella]
MNIRFVCFCLLLHSLQVLAQRNFGTPFLTGGQLCHRWKCINDKLGLPNHLPPREQFDIALRSLLPEGAWQDVAEPVINACYNSRTKTYSNTCPGQALLHCVVDHLYEVKKNSSLRRSDSCSPVTSYAGLKYMFSQSRYAELEKNLLSINGPQWTIKHYFGSKCCDLPPLFNATVMNECDFESVVHYYEHTSRNNGVPASNIQVNARHLSPLAVNIVNPDDMSPQEIDPLDCCDMSTFIEPSWRQDCNFRLQWDKVNRLTIQNQTVTTTPTPTSTIAPPLNYDIRVVPLACEKQTCVFNKLSVLSDTGAVDLDAYTKFLDNFTTTHTKWSKAKARVITECLHKPLLGYEGKCEINKILSCTLDVLSENCPNSNRKTDPCKSSTGNMTCQISLSKYRPKYRRSICNLPKLVPDYILEDCGLTTLTEQELVAIRTPSKSDDYWTNARCQDSTESTKCLMEKMNVINKFGFMDYYRMKERIRTASQGPWYYLSNLYTSSFFNTAMYLQHCNSPKKLLNVIDTMLMTCPISKRRSTPQCERMFADTIYSIPLDRQKTDEKLHQTLAHFPHVFLPPATRPLARPFFQLSNNHKIRYHAKPQYNYGLLSSGNEPTVRTIDLTHKTSNKSLVLLPLYLQNSNRLRNKDEPQALPVRDGLFRNGPLPLPTK